MSKIARLLLIVVLSTAPVVTPARADGYGPPLGPLAFIITNGALVSCYDMYAHVSSTGIGLKGMAYKVNNQRVAQAVSGYAFISGDQVVWGFEAFPTAAAQVAAKLGGFFLLNTLMGNGFGYHIIPSGMIPFSYLFRLGLGPCQDFVA